METEVDGAVKMGLGIYEMMAPLITAALGWVAVKLGNLIRAKTKNEYLASTLARLNDSVFDAVKSVNQQSKRMLEEARDPASPGGEKITKEEADMLKNAAMEHVKSYWGKKGMKELGKVLGFGGLLGFGKDEAGVEKLISDKIEAAVHDVKKAGAGSNP